MNIKSTPWMLKEKLDFKRREKIMILLSAAGYNIPDVMRNNPWLDPDYPYIGWERDFRSNNCVFMTSNRFARFRESDKSDIKTITYEELEQELIKLIKKETI